MPKVTKGEESIAFHFQLGLAVSIWTQIEIELNSLVLSFFNDSDHPALALGFFSVENFRSKLQYVDAIVTRKLVDTNREVLQDWGQLTKRISSSSSNRNKLAHRQMLVFSSNPAGKQFALVPWKVQKPTTERERRSPPADSVFLQDINRFYLEFYALAHSLKNFSARAHRQQEPFPKSLELPKNPMTVVQLVRQIRKGLGDPHLSSREKRRSDDEKNAAASLKDTEGKTNG